MATPSQPLGGPQCPGRLPRPVVDGRRITAPCLYFGGDVCATCGQPRPDLLDEPPLESIVNPQAFRDGERLAYDRVLAYLATLPEEAATRGRDTGRGMSHAVRDLVVYVTTLRADLGEE